MKKSKEDTWLNCGCSLIVVACNLLFGGMSVNYLLAQFMSQTIPIFWAIVIGLFVGQFTIPTAIVVWVLKLTGIL